MSDNPKLLNLHTSGRLGQVALAKGSSCTWQTDFVKPVAGVNCLKQRLVKCSGLKMLFLPLTLMTPVAHDLCYPCCSNVFEHSTRCLCDAKDMAV